MDAENADLVRLRDAKECDMCETNDETGPLLWCSNCTMVLCENCWPSIPTHYKKMKYKSRVTLHEKTNLKVADLIQTILDGGREVSEVPTSHDNVLNTKWFAVVSEPNNPIPQFYNSERFRTLLFGISPEYVNQFPSLVSFVGETGAGKSTLINAAVKIKSGSTKPEAQVVPVMGQETGDPMSGDVHLFADPETYHTSRPLLYGDCEGLGGGNNPARGSITEKLSRLSKNRDRQGKQQVAEPITSYMPRFKVKDIYLGIGENRSQQWIVNNLYPTILFTFSDVVCFVTRSTRKIESHVTNLISWAEKAFDRSLNQPMLPYAIIVINALDLSNEKDADQWWDTEYATKILSRHDGLVDKKDATFKGQIPKYAKWWRERGKKIETLHDLLLCYYSGFKIVCIPHANYRPALISEQYKKLYSEISEASKFAEKKREKVGLLMTSEELDRYFELALEHFSRSSEEPFNFLNSALKYNPINPTFKDHVLNLLVHIKNNFPKKLEWDILRDVAPLVASCIFLDIFRQRYPYRGNSRIAVEGYKTLCAQANKEFYQKYWQCEARDPKNQNRCVNVASGHPKGHQSSDGKIFRAGKFTSSFQSYSAEFQTVISSKLEELFQKQSQSMSNKQETKYAALLHAYESLSKVRSFLSKSNSMTCFCCLNSTPQHTLKCGHIICRYCLEEFSHPSTCGNFLNVSICPLCYNVEEPWNPEWKGRFEPQRAGLRILSLDGGGIRSIIQLTILELLENNIGLGVPIQDFFDLIIGTSGGGIVAFGLGFEQMDIKSCTERFKDLSKKAFKKRRGGSIPVWRRLVEARHHGKFETRGLEEALKDAFQDRPIFGTDQTINGRVPTKVGVTTTSSSHHPHLLTNYNRQVKEPCMKPLVGNLSAYLTFTAEFYSFFRSLNPSTELRVWEALRASSAAPTYFKPFYHEPSGHTFSDGGLKHNNPASLADLERKQIWPHLANSDPDILLSIGTGCELSTGRENKNQPGPKIQAGVAGFTLNLMRVATNSLQDVMDGEKAWGMFLRSTQNTHKKNSEKMRKYCRLNVPLSEVPKLDKVDRIDDLQASAEAAFKQNTKIKSVAATLIASLFYLEELRGPQDKISPNQWQYTGTIFCRLSAGSPQLKELCKRLLDQTAGPPRQKGIFFKKYWDPAQQDDKFKPLSFKMESLRSLCSDIVCPVNPENEKDQPAFELPISFSSDGEGETRICLQAEDQYVIKGEENKYLISGFPRYLEGQRQIHQARHPLSRVNNTLRRHAPSLSSSRTSSGVDSHTDDWSYWRFQLEDDVNNNTLNESMNNMAIIESVDELN